MAHPIHRAGAALLLAAGLLHLTGCGQSVAQGGPPMAPPVSVAPAVQRDIPLHEDLTGRLEAPESVDVRARVAGTIERVHFRDGQEVRRGELLFSLDPRPFAAEVARAEAQVAAARSAATLAGTELERTNRLIAQKAVSQQEADQANAAALNAQASLRAAEAALTSARLHLDYTAIRAPIAGKASRALLTAGNLVAAGDPVLTHIVALDKVHAWFDLPEPLVLAQLKAGGKAGALKVAMGLADEAGHPHAGHIDFVDNRLNPATGALRARAVFDNKDRRFVPGLFARVRVSAGVLPGAVLTPERAIGTDQNKRFVFVVGADKTAQFREVRPGVLLDGMRVITSGLKPGEQVVVNGLQRVRPGAPLAPEVLPVDANGMPVEKPAAPPQPQGK